MRGHLGVERCVGGGSKHHPCSGPGEHTAGPGVHTAGPGVYTSWPWGVHRTAGGQCGGQSQQSGKCKKRTSCGAF